MLYTRIGQQTVNAVRLVEVLQVFVKHGFADLLRRAGFQNGLPAKILRSVNLMEAPQGEPATFGMRLRAALTELGPTYIKFGQILSTRSDVIGQSMAQELSLLQDQVAPVPFDKMARLIEDSLGAPVADLFATFDETPVATASLSQVYKATLSDGTPVAVKVQRPNLHKPIESDIGLMRQIAEWLEQHVEELRWLDPPGVVDEFARSIRRELDFSIEARVIDQFRANFADNPAIFVPQVYHEISSPGVLVMDWVDGVRVDALDEYPARNCDPQTIALLGCEMLCEMVFRFRLFHADPHPGNVFITRDNQLAFLDLGMAGHIERTDVVAISDLFLAMFQGDAHECVNAILNLTQQGQLDNPDALEHEIAEFVAFEAQTIISGGQVAKGIERAMQILHRHHLELAPRFSLLLKSLATIEIVGRGLYPKLDFLPVLQPYIERLIAERFQPVQLMKEAQKNAMSLVRLSRQLPGDIGFLLQRLRSGKLRFQIQHEHLESLVATVDRASNRITVGLVVSALIVGSSMLVARADNMRHLGLAGYIFAGLLGLYLVISILWSRKV